MVIRVSLLGRRGDRTSPSPGRDLLASGAHTFAQLGAAIDRAFARWDLAHLHEFRLPDGRVIGMGDVDELEGDESEIDERAITIGAAGLAVGDSFEYVFDLGDGWEHSCTILRRGVDPVEESGRTPTEIVPIFGWGDLPDQYGRSGPESMDPSDRPALVLQGPPAEVIAMAELKAKQRKSMNKGVFAYVDKDGEGHLPLNDESHIRNAMARWNQTKFESPAKKEGARRKIVGAAKRHGIDLSTADNVAKPRRRRTAA